MAWRCLLCLPASVSGVPITVSRWTCSPLQKYLSFQIHFLTSPSLWVAKTCMRCLRGWVTASCLWPSVLNRSQGRRAERSQHGLICWLYWRLWGDSTWETLLRLHWLLPLKVVLITDCSHPACQIDLKPLFSGLSCTFTNKVSFMPYLLSFLEDLVGQY